MMKSVPGCHLSGRLWNIQQIQGITASLESRSPGCSRPRSSLYEFLAALVTVPHIAPDHRDRLVPGLRHDDPFGPGGRSRTSRALAISPATGLGPLVASVSAQSGAADRTC